MSHPEQLAFFRLCAETNARLVQGSRALEIGSYDVNGSVRAIFREVAEYCGVDLLVGPGVDRVTYGHEVDDPDGAWDIALSAECFEHDPHWRSTLCNMVRLVRPGGLVIVSCASKSRVEHGTRRTSVVDSPGTQFEGVDYYRNVLVEEVESLPLRNWFSSYEVFYNPTSADLYLAGVKAGSDPGRPIATLPPAEDLARLRSMMPARQRVVRYPVRLLRSMVRNEGLFQALAVPYWTRMTRLVAWKDRRKLHLRGTSPLL